MKVIKKAINHYFKEPVSDFRNEGLKSFQNGSSSIYRFVFALLFIFLLFFMPIISFDYARSTDETFSNDYGKDILKYIESGGKDKSVFDLSKQSYKDLIYYGLSFDFLCAVVNKYISPFGEFETRHLLNALFGFLAIVFAALIALKLVDRLSAQF